VVIYGLKKSREPTKMIQQAIAKIVDNTDLAQEEMTSAMEEVMSGGATDAQIAAFITALRMKGETVDEITAAASVMREKATVIDAGGGVVVDTCGTGGDSSGTFNISTTAAFIVAGAGVKVAKHGNRSVSSRSGSADVLKSLGVNIEVEVACVEDCLKEAGIGFLFAPLLHGAMKYAIGPRREIAIRTIFNILGPLTNPAKADCQVMGVFDAGLTEKLARVLGRLGSRHAMVVHGSDGLDEITLSGTSRISELKDGKVSTYDLDPASLGLKTCSTEDIKGGDSAENAIITEAVLKGEKGPKREISLLNAAAALVVAGMASDMKDGLAVAAESVDSGAAYRKLELLREITGRQAGTV